MGRQRKESCYLEKKCVGYWGLGYVYKWIAYDTWNHEVARARTKKECEKNARMRGYTPR